LTLKDCERVLRNRMPMCKTSPKRVRTLTVLQMRSKGATFAQIAGVFTPPFHASMFTNYSGER
jgi:hypothetical protein